MTTKSGDKMKHATVGQPSPPAEIWTGHVDEHGSPILQSSPLARPPAAQDDSLDWEIQREINADRHDRIEKLDKGEQLLYGMLDDALDRIKSLEAKLAATAPQPDRGEAITLHRDPPHWIWSECDAKGECKAIQHRPAHFDASATLEPCRACLGEGGEHMQPWCKPTDTAPTPSDEVRKWVLRVAANERVEVIDYAAIRPKLEQAERDRAALELMEKRLVSWIRRGYGPDLDEIIVARRALAGETEAGR